MRPQIPEAFEYLDANFEHHIERIEEFIQQPTISTEGIGIVEGAHMVKNYLHEAGFDEVELVDTGGNPGIWAKNDVGAEKTIASYGFFDSRPVGPRPWTYKPFVGKRVEDPENGCILIGRGSSSPKGPLVAWINALESMIKTDTLPVNVMMLIEGEEILGSPNYDKMFEMYRSELAEADAAFTGGMSQSGSGGVSVHLGFRGFLVLDLHVSGEKWGRGPSGMAVHSSKKTVLDSPVSRLAHVLASLTDETGSKIDIPVLSSWTADVPDEDRKLFDELIDRADNKGVTSLVGLGNRPAKWDLKGEDLLCEYLYSPTMNINGLSAGNTGPGAEVFTIPESATARLDIRLPMGLKCDQVLSDMRQYLDDLEYSDVEIDVVARHDAFRIPNDADIVQATCDTYRSMGLDPVIWPYAGGGGPWSLFWHELEIPLIFNAGPGGGGRRDRGDEYLLIDGNDNVSGLLDAQKFHISALSRYSEIS